MTRIELEDGKYTVVGDRGLLAALRYGETWRDLTGDKLIGAMVSRIETLESEAASAAIELARVRSLVTKHEDTIMEGLDREKALSARGELAAWPIQGIRVDRGTVVIVAKGNERAADDASRWMCGELLAMKGGAA
jgi:hypothetical protein